MFKYELKYLPNQYYFWNCGWEIKPSITTINNLKSKFIKLDNININYVDEKTVNFHWNNQNEVPKFIQVQTLNSNNTYDSIYYYLVNITEQTQKTVLLTYENDLWFNYGPELLTNLNNNQGGVYCERIDYDYLKNQNISNENLSSIVLDKDPLIQPPITLYPTYLIQTKDKPLLIETQLYKFEDKYFFLNVNPENISVPNYNFADALMFSYTKQTKSGTTTGFVKYNDNTIAINAKNKMLNGFVKYKYKHPRNTGKQPIINYLYYEIRNFIIGLNLGFDPNLIKQSSFNVDTWYKFNLNEFKLYSNPDGDDMYVLNSDNFFNYSSYPFSIKFLLTRFNLTGSPDSYVLNINANAFNEKITFTQSYTYITDASNYYETTEKKISEFINKMSIELKNKLLDTIEIETNTTFNNSNWMLSDYVKSKYVNNYQFNILYINDYYLNNINYLYPEINNNDNSYNPQIKGFLFTNIDSTLNINNTLKYIDENQKEINNIKDNILYQKYANPISVFEDFTSFMDLNNFYIKWNGRELVCTNNNYVSSFDTVLPSNIDEYQKAVNSQINSANADYKIALNSAIFGTFSSLFGGISGGVKNSLYLQNAESIGGVGLVANTIKAGAYGGLVNNAINTGLGIGKGWLQFANTKMKIKAKFADMKNSLKGTFTISANKALQLKNLLETYPNGFYFSFTNYEIIKPIIKKYGISIPNLKINISQNYNGYLIVSSLNKPTINNKWNNKNQELINLTFDLLEQGIYLSDGTK